jgi:deoxycytidylate deaminase
MAKDNIESEIVIGLVAPLGAEKDNFRKLLKIKFQEQGYEVQIISLTNLILNKEKMTYFDYCKKLKLYFKMQYCSMLREKCCKSFLACIAIQEISKHKANKIKKIAYIIDQLKHPSEYRVLSHTYGLSYIQISVFSNQKTRDNRLKNDFKNDNEAKHLESTKLNISKYFNKIYFSNKVNKEFNGKKLIKDYIREILPDGTHNLINKDMYDTDKENFGDKTGQNVSGIFHLSHYFFNLDCGESIINSEINKFIKLLFGKFTDYPTQHEFGMALAYHASYRSTFPNSRHVGACIISPFGEVISVSSIRAPTSSSNTTLEDENNISEGYYIYKDKIKKYSDSLDALINTKKKNKNRNIDLEGIQKLINESIEFHPCTHAEMSALADTAKIGVSVRGATMYTTTFPCHICAKDIITFGIKKVIYLEQYPKSKNSDLYPEIISFDDEGSKDKIPFVIYSGIGPKRYHYVYDLQNKPNNEDTNTEGFIDICSQTVPIFLKFEKPKFNDQRENDIINFFKSIVNNRKKGIALNKNKKHYLQDLLDVTKDK